MEEDLHGKWGYVTYEVDHSSRIVRTVAEVPAIDGQDVQITIDLDQQQYAEQRTRANDRNLSLRGTGLDKLLLFQENGVPVKL